jgi:hypothetical protein
MVWQESKMSYHAGEFGSYRANVGCGTRQAIELDFAKAT